MEITPCQTHVSLSSTRSLTNGCEEVKMNLEAGGLQKPGVLRGVMCGDLCLTIRMIASQLDMKKG